VGTHDTHEDGSKVSSWNVICYRHTQPLDRV